MSSLSLQAAVEAHLPFLWRYVRGFGLDASAADDVVQEAFLIFTQKWSKVEAGKERSFLIGCAMRIMRAQSRKGTRYQELSTEPRGQDNVEEQEQRRQARELLASFVDSLSSKHQPVFVLYELQDFSVPDISHLLGIPEGTVSSRLRTSREEYRRFVNRMARDNQSPQPLLQRKAPLETTA